MTPSTLLNFCSGFRGCKLESLRAQRAETCGKRCFVPQISPWQMKVEQLIHGVVEVTEQPLATEENNFLTSSSALLCCYAGAPRPQPPPTHNGPPSYDPPGPPRPPPPPPQIPAHLFSHASAAAAGSAAPAEAREGPAARTPP